MMCDGVGNLLNFVEGLRRLDAWRTENMPLSMDCKCANACWADEGEKIYSLEDIYKTLTLPRS